MEKAQTEKKLSELTDVAKVDRYTFERINRPSIHIMEISYRDTDTKYLAYRTVSSSGTSPFRELTRPTEGVTPKLLARALKAEGMPEDICEEYVMTDTNSTDYSK